ncbi:DNA-binding protein [Dendryphion nanum]|uniref:DNA-binding protein n=1 Tax=Dendryphion nanum TaxID=256645 RepID=A0A9P9D8G7_9PLEO|nr:DNA-binding protein [Dendryphion nanum]
MPYTYHETLTHFTNFLTAYIHTLLYLRTLYPPTSFTTSRFHNTPVHQSRHPAVCEWITDATTAVRDELLLGTVARIGIVIYNNSSNEATGSPKIMERYMFDVSKFPVIAKGDRNTELVWEDEKLTKEDKDKDKDKDQGKGRQKQKQKPSALDAGVEVNLSEQFRAALLALTTRCAKLSPLPKACSFNISMELKDDPEMDPPIRHPQPWVPAQPSLQKTGRRRGTGGGDEKGEGEGEGEDLGGVKVTPLRVVEAGTFRFETWIEEGKAKFEVEGKAKSSFASEGA